MSNKEQEIREALAAATQGPWVYVESINRMFADRSARFIACFENDHSQSRQADIYLIAHSPEWLRYLLTKVESLHSQQTEWQQAVESEHAVAERAVARLKQAEQKLDAELAWRVYERKRRNVPAVICDLQRDNRILREEIENLRRAAKEDTND